MRKNAGEYSDIAGVRTVTAVTAPMAGMVLEVLAAVGDEVIGGQQVAVLESMKMEVPLLAEASGRVIAVHVQTGDFVNQGDALLVMDP